MANARPDNQAFQKAVDAAVMELVQREHFADRSIIKMPLFFPTGTGVTVEIFPQGRTVIISDNGVAFYEVQSCGADEYFNRSARAIAREAGIEFDERAFSIRDVPWDQIAGAATVVAESAFLVSLACVRKLDERKDEEDVERLYERLVTIYTAERIAKRAPFKGDSQHEWRVDNIVQSNGHYAIFEHVRPQHNSVTSVAAKFHDIARLEKPPARVSVVESKKEMGDFLGVLSQASNVIEINAPNGVYSKAAGFKIEARNA